MDAMVDRESEASAMGAPELLSVGEMAAADKAAIAGGIPGIALMEAAGRAVVHEILRRWERRPVVVLCGPGNNGGDGFVVARLLKDSGWPVRLGLLGDRRNLKGDAEVNSERWDGACEPLSEDLLEDAPLVVDALFGAGLSKPLEGTALAIVTAINASALDCVAVDMPSGIDGDTGGILGAAPKAAVTVTFFRLKPGHLLEPGRSLMGEVVCADIGIPEHVLGDIAPKTFANGPALWLRRYPRHRPQDNKYTHGHAVVVGGAEMTGAARLAATAARRIGAGLASIAAPARAIEAYAAGDPGNIVKTVDDAGQFAALAADKRFNAFLVGPGAGLGARTRDLVLAALATGRAVVLDADALTVFADAPEDLFGAIAGNGGSVLMTPHEGEFARIFDSAGDKLTRTREAARLSGAVVLLKGGDTVIAAPDGRAVINSDAPASLATAGSGDVLAGFAVGLMAQGMDALDAGCAAAWLHGRAARAFGPGLIAEDLAGALSGVLHELLSAGDN